MDINKLWIDLTKSHSRYLKKSRRQGKVAVKRQVTRKDGSTHMQTYYVNPSEVKYGKRKNNGNKGKIRGEATIGGKKRGGVAIDNGDGTVTFEFSGRFKGQNGTHRLKIKEDRFIQHSSNKPKQKLNVINSQFKDVAVWADNNKLDYKEKRGLSSDSNTMYISHSDDLRFKLELDEVEDLVLTTYKGKLDAMGTKNEFDSEQEAISYMKSEIEQFKQSVDDSSKGEKLDRKEAKAKVDEIKKQVGADELVRLIKENGITWKEHEKVGVNKMRAFMALREHFENGGELNFNGKRQESNVPDRPKPERKPRQKREPEDTDSLKGETVATKLSHDERKKFGIEWDFGNDDLLGEIESIEKDKKGRKTYLINFTNPMNPDQSVTIPMKRNEFEPTLRSLRHVGKDKEFYKIQVQNLKAKHGKDKLMELAKQQGITWSESDKDNVNYMRAAMAIRGHLESGNPFNEGENEERTFVKGQDVYMKEDGFYRRFEYVKGGNSLMGEDEVFIKKPGTLSTIIANTDDLLTDDEILPDKKDQIKERERVQKITGFDEGEQVNVYKNHSSDTSSGVIVGVADDSTHSDGEYLVKIEGRKRPIRVRSSFIEKQNKKQISKVTRDTNLNDLHTNEQVEEWASLQLPEVSFSFKAYDLDTSREVTRALVHLSSLYPNLTKTDTFKQYGDPDELLGNTHAQSRQVKKMVGDNAKGKHTMAVHAPLTRGIYFNVKFKSEEDFNKSIQDSQRVNWLNQENVYDCAVHEIGHAVHFMINTNDNINYEPKQELANMLKGRGKKQRVESEVSRYAATKHQELIAESFAVYHRNGDSSSSMVKEVLEKINNLAHRVYFRPTNSHNFET